MKRISSISPTPSLARGAVAIALCLSLAAPASAGELAPYDGRLPFKCKPQRVGTGVDFPRPKADPFCVVFDKTNQDLGGLGMLDFLFNEPGRFAGAGGKCFYYQRDEWRGSVLEGGEGELYHWNGEYFFDLARGAGGAYFENVRLAGNGGDPAYLDYVPEPLRAYLHPTGGGGYLRFEYPADPGCAARVDTARERRKIYRPWYRGVG